MTSVLADASAALERAAPSEPVSAGLPGRILPAGAAPAGPLPAGHPEVRQAKIGVLLLNLGTPEGTDYFSVRRYLREFLLDPRVIELPRSVWTPILYGVVLNTRPQRTGKNYAKIWDRERNESPLRVITRAQGEKLAERLRDDNRLVVEWGMRYGTPSVASAVKKLIDQGCDRILSFPLYPQYSATTTASANDQLFRALMKLRHMPSVRTVPAYHDEPVYIEALARSVEEGLSKLSFEPEKVLASFHGIPKSYFLKGDPYHCHCQKTARLLAERLGWPEGRLMTTFQSRFGAQEWLQPYTDKTVEALAKGGTKRIAVLSPGFSADCIETLEEIDGENREIFLHHGGEDFAYLPCLNDTPGGMDVIETIARRELQGWV
ncbi:MAG TPA: ferrochelatase [Mesorhizobium sp.]|jgi:ferrochelatase|nr:ferrochelatase [Mesorhizobium sp.]